MRQNSLLPGSCQYVYTQYAQPSIFNADVDSECLGVNCKTQVHCLIFKQKYTSPSTGGCHGPKFQSPNFIVIKGSLRHVGHRRFSSVSVHLPMGMLSSCKRPLLSLGFRHAYNVFEKCICLVKHHTSIVSSANARPGMQ